MCCNLWQGLFVILIGAGLVGCETNTETGALAGGAGGALVGGTIGSLSHSRGGEGALIGAAVGAIGGALVGNQIDRSESVEHGRVNEAEYDRRRSYGDSITKNDVVTWSKRGVSDEVIIDRIDRSNASFHLTAADINDLRDRGVSPCVIEAMQDTGRR
ncbi:MAG TPA: YMGG-like glycine zipper-containing protein [Tepidisphaeraceae bacterium]|nr:YMGG-like glycine zipper-containing protein [Tepidisphaeraceae bacterium]